MSDPMIGRCECGSVQFEVDGPLRDIVNCHCSRCRRFTGHHMAATAATSQQVRFTADSTLRWHSPVPSVSYGFCSTCGSSMFWRTTAHPDHLSICAGSLQQPTGLRTASALWMAEHGDYHVPDPGLVEHPYDG